MRKFTDWDNISDDEIRIIGDRKSTKPRRSRWVIVPISVLIIGLIVLLSFISINQNQSIEENEAPSLFEPTEEIESLTGEIAEEPRNERFGREVADTVRGFCEIRDTIINDVSLRIFIPHNARASLHLGKLDKADTTIIYAAQAADVRADNGGIVGAFVLKGKPLAWGLSKRGYCAIIDDVVTVGVADNSTLFERATETEGYFFRQYPLVENGTLVDNAPKGKTIRRALCDRRGEIFMVESQSAESFHDFAQALTDLGCDNAIYLVGSSAYGWEVDKEDVKHEFGEDNYYTGRHRAPKNITYIVWMRE